MISGQSTTASAWLGGARAPSGFESSVARAPPGFESVQREPRRNSAEDSRQSGSSGGTGAGFRRNTAALRVATGAPGTFNQVQQLAPQPGTAAVAVSIGKTSESEDEKGEGKFTLFHVAVETSFRAWTVQRRYRQFCELHATLGNDMPQLKLPKLPSKSYFVNNLDARFVQERKASLEAYLKELIKLPDVWKSAELVTFVDTPNSTLGLQLQLGRAVNQSMMLETVMQDLQRQLLKCQHTIRLQQKTIGAYEDRMGALEANQAQILDQLAGHPGSRQISSATFEGQGGGRLYSLDSADGGRGGRDRDYGRSTDVPMDQPTGPGGLNDDHRRHSSDDLRLDSGRGPGHNGGGHRRASSGGRGASGGRFGIDDDSSDSEGSSRWSGGSSLDMGHNANLLNDLISPTSPPTPLQRHLAEAPDNAQANPWGSAWGGGGGGGLGGLGFVTSNAPAQASEVLPRRLVPSNIYPNSADEKLDELLSLIQPSEASNRYREGIFQFVAQHVKRTLGATCFCVGPFAQRCYLPDEEILVSAFLCNGQESTWFIRVNEALCKVSGTDQDSGAPGDNRGQVPLMLSNVNFLNTGDTKQLKCIVNDIAIMVSANKVMLTCTRRDAVVHCNLTALQRLQRVRSTNPHNHHRHHLRAPPYYTSHSWEICVWPRLLRRSICSSARTTSSNAACYSSKRGGSTRAAPTPVPAGAPWPTRSLRTR
mmetsp:Transcript_109885/g.319757  ORF Transcript_109885/g.319757 Transcript_109885/m.319757 type:complete len:707 (-) Transcript_109885:1837-3957(-)